MSIQRGRDMYDKRTPRQRPIDTDALRRSRVARGAAMYRASRRDREARAALATIADEAATPPPAA